MLSHFPLQREELGPRDRSLPGWIWSVILEWIAGECFLFASLGHMLVEFCLCYRAPRWLWPVLLRDLQKELSGGLVKLVIHIVDLFLGLHIFLVVIIILNWIEFNSNMFYNCILKILGWRRRSRDGSSCWRMMIAWLPKLQTAVWISRNRREIEWEGCEWILNCLYLYLISL